MIQRFAAPTSTKNKEKKREPQAHSVKKGNVSYFGYKAHVGVDSKIGLVHKVKTTAANVYDVTVTPDLLTCEENFVYGDSGYLGADKRENTVVRNQSGKKIKYKINKRPSQIRNLSKNEKYRAKKSEHQKSSVRAKVEHIFCVGKKFFNYRKTQYRELEKQIQKINMMVALANLYLDDRKSLLV